MNLSPTDRDKLQAYLDALRAECQPTITDSHLLRILRIFDDRLRFIIRQAEREME